MISPEKNSTKTFGFKIALVLLSFLQLSCYSYKWTSHKGDLVSEAPANIKAYFDEFPNGIMTVKAISPSENYRFDAWEKDAAFAKNSLAMHFNMVELKLKDAMPEGSIIVDFTFKDGNGNAVVVRDFDLLRIVPAFNAKGEHLYPELLLEEFNRYGVSLRKEFKEFEILYSDTATADDKNALNRVYRTGITNGCLSAGKWEFNLNTEDFSDFDKRIHNEVNFNQSKILAHSWFLLDKDFYKQLITLKNPDLDLKNVDITGFDYDALSEKSQDIIIDFDALRNPIKKVWKTEMLEVGHQSNRPIEPLDMEEHYKIEYGLFLNHNLNSIAKETYRTIIDTAKQPIKLAQFRDEGFYSDATPLTFDMNWLQYLDNISISAIDIKDTECLSEIKVTGKWSPFTITITNVDLAMIQEQKLYGLHYGFNVYPKGRRYNPAQPTITFDTDLMPKAYEQSLLLTDAKTGTWIDNFKKGLSKVYLTYPTLEKDVLDIYLISYERIIPLWMGRVKLPKELREKVRIRSQLYNY